jgi:hypothetical protein
MGEARAEALGVPPLFGPWLPAKLRDMDFDVLGLRANEELVLACSEGCRPLCRVVAALPGRGKEEGQSILYVLLGPDAPGYPRWCTASTDCRLSPPRAGSEPSNTDAVA